MKRFLKAFAHRSYGKSTNALSKLISTWRQIPMYLPDILISIKRCLADLWMQSTFSPKRHRRGIETQDMNATRYVRPVFRETWARITEESLNERDGIPAVVKHHP